MGTFTKNITPKISSAVTYSANNGVSTARDLIIFSTASDEYAIVDIYYSNISGSGRQLSVGTSSSAVSISAANTSIYVPSIGVSSSSTDQLQSNGYAGRVHTLHIGPGRTLYWGTDTSNGIFLSCNGVIFKNS